MNNSSSQMPLPFEVGALYNRRLEIHGRFGGQQQGGISTPKDSPFVIAFTGEAGAPHGYADFWDEDEPDVFHYYGEGQSGDMRYIAGNLAVRNHVSDGKRLLVFQMMGKRQPYRFWGEFVCLSSYLKEDTPATRGPNRTAIVFKLTPIGEHPLAWGQSVQKASPAEQALGSTVTTQLVEVRTKQTLFKRRLLGVEKECRLTHVRDLRFLRASHIKPWSQCASAAERVDGENGFLLTPHADLLFDRGWVSFEDNGRLLVAKDLPSELGRRIGLSLKPGRKCGDFTDRQRSYLAFHRDHVYERRFSSFSDPLVELLTETALPSST